jgi:Tfp pilus assembly protein PilN
MIPTPMQVFLAVLDFLLFIFLGVIFIRQWMIFKTLKSIAKTQQETQHLIDAAADERSRWIAKNFGIKESDIG